MLRFKEFFYETYSPQEMETANRTSRARGAIGAKAITPKYVQSVSTPEHTILDFGAGRDAAHAQTLKDAGFNVTAHEFGTNQNERHDPQALERQYHTVYASNVLNTQSSPQMMERTLDQIRAATRKGGGFVGNFPLSPRKSGMSPGDVEALLRARFPNVKRVGGTRQAPLWHAHD